MVRKRLKNITWLAGGAGLQVRIDVLASGGMLFTLITLFGEVAGRGLWVAFSIIRGSLCSEAEVLLLSRTSESAGDE